MILLHMILRMSPALWICAVRQIFPDILREDGQCERKCLGSCRGGASRTDEVGVLTSSYLQSYNFILGFMRPSLVLLLFSDCMVDIVAVVERL